MCSDPEASLAFEMFLPVHGPSRGSGSVQTKILCFRQLTLQGWQRLQGVHEKVVKVGLQLQQARLYDIRVPNTRCKIKIKITEFPEYKQKVTF